MIELQREWRTDLAVSVLDCVFLLRMGAGKPPLQEIAPIWCLGSSVQNWQRGPEQKEVVPIKTRTREAEEMKRDSVKCTCLQKNPVMWPGCSHYLLKK